MCGRVNQLLNSYCNASRSQSRSTHLLYRFTPCYPYSNGPSLLASSFVFCAYIYTPIHCDELVAPFPRPTINSYDGCSSTGPSAKDCLHCLPAEQGRAPTSCDSAEHPSLTVWLRSHAVRRARDLAVDAADKTYLAARIPGFNEPADTSEHAAF